MPNKAKVVKAGKTVSKIIQPSVVENEKKMMDELGGIYRKFIRKALYSRRYEFGAEDGCYDYMNAKWVTEHLKAKTYLKDGDTCEEHLVVWRKDEIPFQQSFLKKFNISSSQIQIQISNLSKTTLPDRCLGWNSQRDNKNEIPPLIPLFELDYTYKNKVRKMDKRDEERCSNSILPREKGNIGLSMKCEFGWDYYQSLYAEKMNKEPVNQFFDCFKIMKQIQQKTYDAGFSLNISEQK